ncbi:MAG: hypothetical protein QG652_1776, partial [Pseudomonadota bacterium]|nr:hypothetical protein [Pseudomonadota bacterium]
PGRKAKSGLSQSLHHVGQGLRLMKTSKLLRLSSYSLFFMVISVYVLAYSVNTVYTRHFTSEQELSAFFGLLTAATGTLALLIQLLLTNRLIRDYGVKKLNYIFPLTSLVSYAGLLFSFMLPAAIFASFNRETLMPAFAKPVRNIFTATLPNQVQGRAQAISVIMVIPLGLICAGLFLLLAQKLDTIHYFLFAGLLCSLAYLLCNAGMNRAYAREILLNLKKRLFIPDKQIHAFMDGKQPELIREIEQGLMSHEDDISIVYARVLSKSEPQLAAQLIPQRMSRASNAVKDQMVKILQPVECDAIKNQLRSELGRGDTHLDATLMKALFQSRDPAARQQVATLLNDENPRLRAAGIYGALRYPVPELIEQAVAEWIHLLEKLEADTFMPAVELIVPEFSELYQAPPLLEKVQSKLTAMLHHEEPRFISIALNILATWPAGSLTGMDQTILSLAGNHNWIIRKACVRTAHLLADNAAHTLLFTALEDPHPNVRLAAIEYLAASQVNDISYIQHLLISTRSGSPKAQQTMLEYLMDNGCDSGTLHAISLSLANDARSLKAASLSLTNHARPLTPAASLLRHALDERVLEITDLALFATQSSGQDEDMAVIRAGLRSQDKRQFAQACELLSMINNQPLSQLILPLFDDSPVPLKQEPPTFASLNALVDWIQQRADPWLNECALYFSATLDNSTLSKPCHV